MSSFATAACCSCGGYMPLDRYAHYAQAIDIYVAPTWDCGETWLATLNHIAREGGCWVLGTATALTGSDIPTDFPGRDQLFADEEWINAADAVVVKLFRGVVAGPLHREKAILYATVDAEAARSARKSLDVAGHYGRPDLFRLGIDRRVRLPAAFVNCDQPAP